MVFYRSKLFTKYAGESTAMSSVIPSCAVAFGLVAPVEKRRLHNATAVHVKFTRLYHSLY